MTTTSLEEVVARIAAGDRAAAAELCERFGAGLHALAVRAVGAEAADACVADALVDVWRHAARFDAGAESAARWMTRILGHHVGRVRRGLAPTPTDDMLGATA